VKNEMEMLRKESANSNFERYSVVFVEGMRKAATTQSQCPGCDSRFQSEVSRVRC